MEFDAGRAVEELLAQEVSGEQVSVDRKALEDLLKNAYRRGTSAASASADPDLEAVLFRELMNSIPDYIYFKDCESRFIAVNQAHAEHVGKSPAEVLGRSDFDFFEQKYAQAKFEAEQAIIRTGKGFSPKIEHHTKRDGEEMYVLSTKHPWYGRDGEIRGTFGHSRDVTAAVVAERALAQQHKLLRTLIDVAPCRIFVRDREHRFRILNEEYRRSLDPEVVDSFLGRTLRELVDDPRVAIIQEEDEAIMRTGVPVLRRIEFDSSPVAAGKWLSVSKVPLRTAEGTIGGIVGIAFDISPQKEAEARVRAASHELASKNAQIESELAMARKLQIALATAGFPNRLILESGASVSAAFLYEPCEHLAGDFFHLIRIDQGRFAVLICDVMGHGVRSALVTAMIRGLVEENRSELIHPTSLFNRINRVLYGFARDPDFPRFVTAAYALFDVERNSLTIANAGHPSLLCVSSCPGHTEIDRLKTHRDPALGLVENFSYRSSTSTLQTDSAYLFYTDGLVEQRNDTDQEFGLNGIHAALSSLPEANPVTLVHRLREALANHAGRQSFTDDVCAMALQIRR